MKGPAVLLLLTLAAAPAAAQLPADLGRERQAYVAWLTTAALSPYAAVALQSIGAGLVLGPETGDIPLAGLVRTELREARGAVTLRAAGREVSVPRGRPVPLDSTRRLVVNGAPGRTVAIVYGPLRPAPAPAWFDYDPALVLTVELEPPERRGRFRILGPDGLETEAAEAGFVAVRAGGSAGRLRAYRVGAEDDDEAELLIFFRDATNRHGSYPAGRFVELIPLGGRRYRLDFNRARNPFCAYSTVFPCPAPWPGNQLAAALAAGEKYAGGGLELE